MSNKPRNNDSSTQPCLYDSLLEEFLPVIHNAAHSVCGSHQQTAVSRDLLLAGLSGLKEAFLSLSDANQDAPSNTIIQRIYASMRQQIQLNIAS